MEGELALAVDPDTLLPGEDPDSTDPADGVHWVRVYRDLIELTTVLLERTESALRAMTGDAIREADLDQRLLRIQRERYLSRYEFWTNQVAAAGR
jgi:hypothetical protein